MGVLFYFFNMGARGCLFVRGGSAFEFDMAVFSVCT